MKVLVIDITCAKRAARDYLEVLAQKDDLQLTLLVPRVWRSVHKKHSSANGTDSKLEVIKGRTLFSGYAHRYVFLTSLGRLLRQGSYDIIHLAQEPYSLLGLEVLLLSRLFSPRSKIVFRTSDPFKTLPFKFSFLYSWAQRHMFKKAPGAYAVSDSIKEVLQEKGYEGHIWVVPHARNPEVFKKMDVKDLKDRLGLKSGYTIGYVGRLAEEKGVPLLLEAASGLDFEFELLLVGSGPWSKELPLFAERLGLSSRLKRVESLPLEEIPRYMNCMDVLVLPSLTTQGWKETFGRVLVEAMMCEVAVIGSDCGEIPEVIGEAGLLFPEGDAEALKEALERLWREPSLRESLAKRGREWATERFSPYKVAEEYHKIYLSLQRNRG